MNSVKANLELFIPALIELIDFNDFPWKKIDQAFLAKWEQRTIASGGEKMLIEASVFDIIIEAKKDNLKAIGLLDFFNKLFEELADSLTRSEKILIRSNAKAMLKSLDSKYLNFLGEMAVLNNLIKTGVYRLNSIEYQLSNGKSIDFKLTYIPVNQEILVEIVNLHLDTDKVEDNAVVIEKFLTHKLANKMASKKLNLDKDVAIYLIPVLWGGWKEVKIYSDFFKYNKLSLPHTLEPLAYLQYNDGISYFEHYFKSVSHLFNG